MSHGRASIPFGKYKNVRIILLPSDYLSWLTTAPMMRQAQWKWLWDSVIAELKFRGLNYELAATDDPPPIVSMPVLPPNKRKFRDDLKL